MNDKQYVFNYICQLHFYLLENKVIKTMKTKKFIISL